MKHDFQLAYTISSLDTGKPQHVASAEKARTILRHNLGWETTGDIETTLLGQVELAPATLDDKAREAKRQVRMRIKGELESADVIKHIEFEGSLMVNGLGSAITLNIP